MQQSLSWLRAILTVLSLTMSATEFAQTEAKLGAIY